MRGGWEARRRKEKDETAAGMEEKWGGSNNKERGDELRKRRDVGVEAEEKVKREMFCHLSHTQRTVREQSGDSLSDTSLSSLFVRLRQTSKPEKQPVFLAATQTH